MFNTKFRSILYCYSEEGAKPKIEGITYHKGMPTDEQIGIETPQLLILDDLMNVAYSQAVADLFTKGSHHRDLSVILITQNIFNANKFSRTISLNAGNY